MFGGRTRGTRINLTRRCINPNTAKKLTDLGFAIEWGLSVRQLEPAYARQLSGDFGLQS